MSPPAPGYIKTACRNCGQHIEAPVEYGGTFVPCPTCGETVAIPEAAPTAPLPSSPQVTQRIHMPAEPPPPPPRAPAPPSAAPRPAPDVPPTPISDAYLVPTLLIFVGIAMGLLVGLGVLAPNHPAVVLVGLLLPLVVFVLVVGYLGAIAARLKTIELLLRRK